MYPHPALMLSSTQHIQEFSCLDMQCDLQQRHLYEVVVLLKCGIKVICDVIQPLELGGHLVGGPLYALLQLISAHQPPEFSTDTWAL